jgi:hypothetical protein
MLLFSSDTFTVDGITVFPDHADKNQFWYLPGPVTLEKQDGTGEPEFLLTMFAPDVAASGVQGSGFLTVTLCLNVSDMTKSKIMGQIRSQFSDADDPRLAPVPFDEGTVQIMALDLQGGGGTNAVATPPGTFHAVENVLGAVTPELFGNNDALFGLKLSEEGATILETAFEDGLAPAGAIYNLKFTGVLPSLDVKITADLKRAYQSFSVGLEAKAYWVSAGIEATFEQLRQDGAIKVEVVNLSTSTSVADKEQWALNLFKDQIMSQWFQPSLTPATAAAASVTMPTLSSTPAKPPTTPTTPTFGAKPPVTPTTPSTVKPPTTTAPAGAVKPPATFAAPSATTAAVKAPATTAAVTAPATAAATPAAPAAGTAGATAAAAAAGAPGATVAAPAAAASAAAGAVMPAAPVTPVGAIPAATPSIPAATNPAKAVTSVPGTAAAASSAASPFGVALQLKYVQQDELKTVEIEYNRMDAVQRTYAPQGPFGLVMQGLDKSKHFLKVDGTDVFFNKFIVTGNAPKDFATIGLQTAHVAMDYGDPQGSGPVKHGEFLFDPSNPATNPPTQTWPIFEGLVQETSYTYTADYKFDPESGWVGEQTAYVLPAVKTDNRVLNLDPHDFLGFLTVNVSPGRMDANLVDRIDVALQYTGKSGWQTSTTITVKPDSKPQAWKLRLTDKNDPTFKYSEYQYSTTCYLKDGTAFNSGPFTSSASAILVSDPFGRALDLLFQPAFDPTATKLAIVEVSYNDDANHYSFQTSFEILGTTATPTKIHIPLIDNKVNQYKYRVTLLGTSNQRTQGDYITATDPLVLVTV